MNQLVLQSVAVDEINLHALHRADLNNEDIFFRLVLTIGMAKQAATISTPH